MSPLMIYRKKHLNLKEICLRWPSRESRDPDLFDFATFAWSSHPFLAGWHQPAGGFRCTGFPQRADNGKPVILKFIHPCFEAESQHF